MPEPRERYLDGEYGVGPCVGVERSDGFYANYLKCFFSPESLRYPPRPRGVFLACNLKMQQARGVNDAANSSSGHAPRMPAVDVSLAFEVSGFVVELVAKRPRIEPERLDSRPEDAGTAAMVNRDYDAE